jgi:hypothetical protein
VTLDPIANKNYFMKFNRILFSTALLLSLLVVAFRLPAPVFVPGGGGGGTNIINYYFPASVTASATNVPAGGSATASVAGTNSQTWVLGIPVGRDGTNGTSTTFVTNIVNITNIYSTTNVYAAQFTNAAALAVLDAAQPEQTITGNITFTGVSNAPSAGITRYVGMTVVGVATIDYPSDWGAFSTHPITVTNAVLAFKAMGSSNRIAIFNP